MLSVLSVIKETVKQLNTIRIRGINSSFSFLRFGPVLNQFFAEVLLKAFKPFLLHPVRANLVEDLNFIKGSFQVVGSAALYFKGDVGVELNVLGKPDSREVTPA